MAQSRYSVFLTYLIQGNTQDKYLILSTKKFTVIKKTTQIQIYLPEIATVTMGMFPKV